MFLDVQHDVKVAGWAAKNTGLAQTAKSDARAIFYARRNFRFYGALPQQPPFAFALRARIRNHRSRALTGRASARNAEKSLLISYLAVAAASPATDRRLTRRSAGSTAIFTSLVSPYHNLGIGAKDRFLKLKGYIFAKICSALGAASPA
jgi:hypothetical protein